VSSILVPKIVRWQRSPGEQIQPPAPEERGWLTISVCHVGALASVLADGSEVVANASIALLSWGQPTVVATKARVHALGVEVRLNRSSLQSCNAAHELASSAGVSRVTPRVRWTEALLVRSSRTGDTKQTMALAADLARQRFQSAGAGGIDKRISETGHRRVAVAKLILASSFSEALSLSTMACVITCPSYFAQLFHAATTCRFMNTSSSCAWRRRSRHW
jgi:hypothetical protein